MKMEERNIQEDDSDTKRMHVHQPDEHDLFFASRKLYCSKDGISKIRDIVEAEVTTALSKLPMTEEKRKSITGRILEAFLVELETKVFPILTSEEKLNEVLLPRLSQLMVEVTSKRKNVPPKCRSLRKKNLRAQEQLLRTENFAVDQTEVADPPALEAETVNYFNAAVGSICQMTQDAGRTLQLLKSSRVLPTPL